MNNPIFSTLSIATTLSVSLPIFAQENAKVKRPNIVVFIADDAGMDFGCYGNPNISTPNIDKLARDGIRFQNAFLTSPQSSPSRTSMLSGKFAHTIGTEDLHSGLDNKTSILPKYLHQGGYTTAYMLKTHWGDNGDKQWDYHIEGNYLPNQGPLEEGIFQNYTRFLDQHKSSPFFLWVGFVDPHRPYNRNNTVQINSPKKIKIPPYLVNDAETKRDFADYYNELSRMDKDVGRMMRELEQRGLMENTIIVFLSDNGMPFPRAKGSLYDSGIQTPLIFSWKGRIEKGVVSHNGLVSTVDLAPTLLDLAGLPIQTDMFGRGFKNILFNHQATGQEYVYSERNWHDTDEYIRCIRSSKYKLIYNAYYDLPHGTPMDLSTSPSWYALKKRQRKGHLPNAMSQIFTSPRAMVEIYDLEHDPYELNNLADRAEYLNIGQQLSHQLVKWQAETNDLPWWTHRRSDQNDRITGFPLFETRPPLWGD
ncbi:MAG: sulfatase [Bacteroidales bacterium]|nr:sulfatase [Bacteroidales bacterium]